MKRVLVMGGTEFVGKAILEGLISKGYKVDFLTRGLKEVTVDGYNNHFICDRKNEQEVKKCLFEIEYDYIFDISAYSRLDVEILIKNIRLCSLKRYVFLSSGAVYTPSSEFLFENSKRGLNPNWGQYGLDKKEAEDYLFSLHNDNKFPFVIFRPTYIYGEGNNLYRETYFFQRILNSLPLPVPNTQNSNTQFIHIKDVVNILLDAITNDLTIGEAYNITHPRQVKWLDLVKTIQKVMNKEKQILCIDQEEMNKLNVSPRHFFPFRDVVYIMNINKLIEHNLPLPKIDLEEGLQSSFEWFLKQNIKEKFEYMSGLDTVATYCLQRNMSS